MKLIEKNYIAKKIMQSPQKFKKSRIWRHRKNESFQLPCINIGRFSALIERLSLMIITKNRFLPKTD
jgi:hypothetical protein